MIRSTVFALAITLTLTACTSVVWPQPLHELKRPIRAGEWYWCMTPTGETTGWDTQGGPGYVGATCDGGSRVSGGQVTNRLHNRFVQVWVCGEGEMPVDDEYVLRANRRPESEVAEMLAARLRLARDNSLVGDRYRGRSFCAPLPPS